MNSNTTKHWDVRNQLFKIHDEDSITIGFMESIAGDREISYDVENRFNILKDRKGDNI